MTLMLGCVAALGCGDAKNVSGDTADPPAQSGGQGGRSIPAQSERDASGAQPQHDAGPPPVRADAATDPDNSVNKGNDAGADAGGATSKSKRCAARPVAGDALMHFHHVHFNTTNVDADLEFFQKYFGAAPIDFCKDEHGSVVTRATKTERGYFLYTHVDKPADPTLNTYLEHVGWIHASPNEELSRLAALGAPLWPEGRAQCAEAAAGQMACDVGSILPDYYFYLEAPSGARIEVAKGPGPATSGFGHVHLIQGVDLGFFATVSDNAYSDGAIDMVNHTDASLTEDILASEMVVDTRGKPIDHIAYSTIDLAGARARIMGAGIAIAEDISFKPDFGFESFFVRSDKGIWVEIVADTPFAP
jgi:catechol 2,3-dioxygenase-like lactoylglutathione lyase family enzyme